MDLMRLLWEHTPVLVGFEEFERRMEGWQLEALHGEHGVAVIFASKGPDFHFTKIDPAYQATKAVLAKYPGSLIERYGYANTKTPKVDARQRRFNERLGFVAVGEDEHDVHYRIERNRMKGALCQFSQ